MLWCNRRKFLTLTGASLALAACGFTPVYAPGQSGSTLQNNVSVNEPTTRNSFLVTRRIEERLGRTSTAAYQLTISVAAVTEYLAVEQEGDINRFNLVGRADYTLADSNTGRVLTSGSIDNFAGYSASGTTVATLASERDAQLRLMNLLADQIIIRLLSADLT